MGKGLLESLITYRPREGKVPLEDFITEAFAWILNKHPDFATYFLSKVLAEPGMQLPEMELENCEWHTQYPFDGKRPDMVCLSKSKEHAIIFEHKTWSELSDGQLGNYKAYAEEKLGMGNFKTVLITAFRSQHGQNPDLAWCWSDVYKFISDWLESKTESSFIFKDFQSLLESENMQPLNPITKSSILAYYAASDLRKNASGIIRRMGSELINPVEHENNQGDIKKIELLTKGNELMYRDASGRIGFEQTVSWRPGLFVGILLDGEDHCTKPIDTANGPDLCLIIDFESDLHNKYPTNGNYKELVKQLAQKVADLQNGFELYNHIEDSTVNHKNYYHPIHIRKPMLDVFASLCTGEKQAEEFHKTAIELISLVIEEDSFWKLRKDCENMGETK